MLKNDKFRPKYKAFFIKAAHRWNNSREKFVTQKMFTFMHIKMFSNFQNYGSDQDPDYINSRFLNF